MADFEGLIRQALARQNADDPAVREKIYQSSRNALARMIAAGKAQSPEAINRQREALENSIHRIEAGYVAQSPPEDREPVIAAPPEAHREPDWTPPPAPPRAAPAIDEVRGGQPQAGAGYDTPRAETPRAASSGPAAGQGAGWPDVRSVPVPEGVRDPYPDYRDHDDVQELSLDADDVPAHARPQRSSRRGFTIAAFILVLLVVGALAYFLFQIVSGDSGQQNPAADPATGVQQPASQGQTTSPADYITVLSPVDTGSLVTAGRGRAEIINQANTDFVRLVSLRSDSALGETANPILLQIEPGVLRQIAGKRVTVEIQAKSGDSGPANFAVGCEINGEDVCGRRRFRIGLQPEATIFPMSVGSNLPSDAKAYLTISTDVTNTALQSGEGSAVDILYARLRLPQAQ